MDFFFSAGFYFKSKVIQVNHKRKNIFVLISKHFFSKCTIFVFVFFLAEWLSNQFHFSVTVRIYKVHVFDEVFFLLTIRMTMVTKLFRVVTCCDEFSPINSRGISTEWSCWVTWQIKFTSPPAWDVSTLQ